MHRLPNTVATLASTSSFGSGSNPIAVVHVVDDDESLRTALKCLLRTAGYEVRTYASVGDFLLNKSGNPHGCVVLDVRMPGPSAFDLQDVLVKLDEPLQIIFLPAYGDIPTSVRSANTDAVDFRTKPIQKEALLRAVSTALAAQAKRRLAREQLLA